MYTYTCVSVTERLCWELRGAVFVEVRVFVGESERVIELSPITHTDTDTHTHTHIYIYIYIYKAYSEIKRGIN
jgi:hypothetical protein